MPEYAELHAHSCFSLLDGASTPEALLDRAAELGLPALALTDHDGLYGAVRFWTAARARGIHPILGAELTLSDASHLVLLAEDRTGYAHLCRLISRARLACAKGRARLQPEWLRGHTAGLIALTGCVHGPVARPLLAGDRDGARAALRDLRALFPPGQFYVELQHHRLRPDDALRADLAQLADDEGVPLVATRNAHYATREGHRLHDVLWAIARHAPLADLLGELRPNSEYALQSADEMAARFSGYPGALENTLEIARRCRVELALRDDALPPAPESDDPDARLADLCIGALPRRYPDDAAAARRQLDHELAVIAATRLAGYFLLVGDIVGWTRDQGIGVRGRGSAANSIVAYLLGITNVDPLAHGLLFERFLSAEARVMPDIDLDFCARRREEVIQHVYARYGAEHVAMVCNDVTYRERGAVRDVGAALGLPADTLASLARRLRGVGRDDLGTAVETLPAGGSDTRWDHFRALCREIQGLPRHLSIHVGGMVITRRPLVELVPIEPATMPGRVVVQWDKDSVEDAGLIKLDLLSLRTLSAVDECLALIRRRHGRAVDLDALPLDDPAVYAALCRADTVGAFQVESRAQQQALVQMRPRTFRDLVVQVAIIRPGPLQGGMVHPFFRRRMGREAVRYAHPMLAPILEETLGVIVFQEQVMRVAMAMGRFSAGEADLLRRAMSRHRSDQAMAAFRERFIEGATGQGVAREVAGAVFAQLAGFAGFGFCKSHAAAFARTAYDTLWLRAHYPAEYYCALLNNQPMGFYPPRILIGDARRHGIETRRVDMARSEARCTVEGDGAIRLGLGYVDGLGEAGIERLLGARAGRAFRDLGDLCRRTRLPRRLVETLILAGALDDWGRDRRRQLWALGRLRYAADELPLPVAPDGVELAPMDAGEELAAEYGATGVSVDGHPMALYRERLRARGVLDSRDLAAVKEGGRVRLGGLVVIRQRPPTAKGFLFLTLEDEWGLMNAIVRPDVFERQREVWARGSILVVQGRVQRARGRVDLLAERAWRVR
jgi:error-prone DNA polymerase